MLDPIRAREAPYTDVTGISGPPPLRCPGMSSQTQGVILFLDRLALHLLFLLCFNRDHFYFDFFLNVCMFSSSLVSCTILFQFSAVLTPKLCNLTSILAVSRAKFQRTAYCLVHSRFPILSKKISGSTLSVPLRILKFVPCLVLCFGAFLLLWCLHFSVCVIFVICLTAQPRNVFQGLFLYPFQSTDIILFPGDQAGGTQFKMRSNVLSLW